MSNLTNMNEEWSRIAADSISNSAHLAGQAVSEAAYCYMDPSVMYRPSIFIDGNQWCALYGENLQDGVAGFGDSPSKAMTNFNKNWARALGEDNVERTEQP